MKLQEIKLEPLLDTLRIEKIDDEVYFTSPMYKNRISNSRLGLLNPRQGGSPEKFFTGFKAAFNPSFALGSAVHQLILQPDDYVLSDYSGKPSGKGGVFIDYLFENRKKGMSIYDAIQTASKQADYYQDRFKDDWVNNTLYLSVLKLPLELV